MPTPPAGVALFAWVKQELLESIDRGEFSRDEPFITQREIVDRFGVSTTTAIRALNELVADGVVVRRRGRGTFVAERPPAAPVEPSPPAGGQRVITYVSPGSGGAHGAELLAGLAAECAERGSRLAVEHTSSAAHEEPVLSRLADGGTHGVVLFTHDASAAAGPLVRLQERGIAVPSGTVLDGKFAIRVAITNHRSRREDFDLLVDAVAQLGRELSAPA